MFLYVNDVKPPLETYQLRLGHLQVGTLTKKQKNKDKKKR